MIEINFGILLAQVITFLIGVALMWKIAWGPLTKTLKERSSVIQKELELAQAKNKMAEELQAKYQAQLAKIEAKAQGILAKANQEARNLRDQMLKSSQDEAKSLVEKTRLALEQEKQRLIQDLRQEMARLAVSGAEKLLRRMISPEIQREWSEEFLAQLEQHARHR